jgi:LacI family transcriptional regulator
VSLVKPAARRPATIKTIALDLGLSISTVSRALKNDALVTPDTRAKVSEAANRLGYRRDLRGVNLRTGRTYTLCALLTSNPSGEFGDPAAMHLIQGLIAGTADTDFKMVIRPVEGRAAQLEACQESVRDGRFDGFILDHTEPQDPRVLFLLERGIPFVTFGRTELFTEHAYFDIDNEDAAFAATKHLADAGHRRIILIDPPQDYLFSGQRYRGYRRALVTAGLPYDPALVIEMGIGIRRVRDRVAEVLAMPDRPTGFVTSNEVATLGALRACRDLPPGEFEQFGFVSRDGTRLFDYLEPPIASMYYPLLNTGRELSAMLVDAVRGADITGLQRLERAELLLRS